MEVWKDISGFEGLYRISNKGNVYSIRRDKVLKPKTDRYGYYAVSLWDNESKKIAYRTIHRLVAEAFLDAVSGCNVVNHLDCDKKNNDVSNLEWTTVQGNTKHAYDNSASFRERVKAVNKMGTEARSIKIDAYLNGVFVGSYGSKKETAEKLGVSEKTVYNRLHDRFTTRSGYTFVKKVVI